MILPLLFCSSCQSKPVNSPSTQEKATLNAAENAVQIECNVAYAARPANEMESAFLFNEKVLSCLRQAPEIRDPQFSVSISGLLKYTGEIENPLVDGVSGALKNCLSREIGALSMNRGRPGAFKLQISRSQPTPGKKPKGVLLDLNNVKKWE